MTEEGPSRRSRTILELATRIRRRLQGDTSDDDEVGLIQFDCGGERFAIEITWVSKIERFPSLTPVPNARSFVRGVANLRGAIVPILDLGLLLDLQPLEGEPEGLLLLKDGPRQFGVASGSLPDYLRVHPEAIEVALRSGDTVSSLLSGAVSLREQELTGILDGAKLFAFIERLADAE